MSENMNINKSLYVPRVNKKYTEDQLAYIFWKFNIGKIDRIDFEPMNNTDFQKAYIYLSNELTSWNFEQLVYNETDKSHRLYLNEIPYQPQNSNSSSNFIDLYNNPTPIPYANTTYNTHQLYHKNLLLEEKIRELEKQISKI